MKLREITDGSEYAVFSVECNGKLKKRLSDMGLYEGAKVTLHGKSPFGDPLSFFVGGTVIAVRKSDCDKIFVEKIK